MLCNRIIIGLSIISLIPSFGYVHSIPSKILEKRKGFWRQFSEDFKDPRSTRQLAYDAAIVIDKKHKKELYRIHRNKCIGDLGILFGIGVVTIGSVYFIVKLLPS